jgi:hypothetical protein
MEGNFLQERSGHICRIVTFMVETQVEGGGNVALSFHVIHPAFL